MPPGARLGFFSVSYPAGQRHLIEASATVSGGSAMVSWFADNLPVLQGLAAIVAIFAGLVAIAWTIYKFCTMQRDG